MVLEAEILGHIARSDVLNTDWSSWVYGPNEGYDDMWVAFADGQMIGSVVNLASSHLHNKARALGIEDLVIEGDGGERYLIIPEINSGVRRDTGTRRKGLRLSKSSGSEWDQPIEQSQHYAERKRRFLELLSEQPGIIETEQRRRFRRSAVVDGLAAFGESRRVREVRPALRSRTGGRISRYELRPIHSPQTSGFRSPKCLRRG